MEVFSKVHRGNVETFTVDRIGRGTQGNIYKISVDGRLAAIKDISKKNWFYRLLIGRRLLSREYTAYQRLQGVEGIPRLYGKIDRDGFIFEYVQGIPLSDFPKNAPLPSSFFDGLADLVRQMHSRGVVHSDLKHKKNILVIDGRRPYLIDFGASWTAGASWNMPVRWFYRQFRQIDMNAVSKIRNRYLTGNPGEQDRERLLRRNIMEKCSTLYQTIYRLFSRKHKWKRRGGRPM